MQSAAVPVAYDSDKIFVGLPSSANNGIFNGYAGLLTSGSSALISPIHSEPAYTPKRKQAHLIVRANKAVRTTAIALWCAAILGYGLDVAVSNDVGKLQDRARRLSEQNTELSAKVLKAISFQGIQDRAVEQLSLAVPEQVLIVKEVPPYPVPGFHPQKHHLPLLPGF